jgi:hypothetical protein
MSFGEILDAGFRLLRNHTLILIGVALPIYIPLAYASSRLETQFAVKPDPMAFLPLLVLIGLSPLVTVALTTAIADYYLGRSVSFGQVLRSTLAVFFPITGTFFLMTFAVLGGLLLLIIPGLYLALSFYLVTTVAVIEKCYGRDALGRSRELMRGNLLRALVIVVISWLLVTVLGMGLGLAFKLAPSLAPLASGIAQAVSFAYLTAVSVVLYFDIRCRKEAFDLEHLAAQVDGAGSVAPPARASA